MKQLKLTLVLTMLMSMVGLQTFAAWDTSTKIEVDGLYYYLDNDNNQAQVTSMPDGKYTGEIEIPSTFNYQENTYSVTSIGEDAFYECSDLTFVTIPNSVTSIDRWAFCKCSSLTSITIPNSVTTIGQYAFGGCSSLASVTLNSNAVASKKYTTSDNLTTIFGVEEREFIIGDEVTSIGQYAFYYCYGLTSITIPNSVTEIGLGAFRGCSRLTSIKVDSSNTNYDSRNDCNAIIVTASNALIVGCKNTVIPNSVTSIADYAFLNCSDLTSITIPNSVTSIGNYAFKFCSGLTSITIPNSVANIFYEAFYGCNNLTSVTLNSDAVVSQAYTWKSNMYYIFGSQVKEYIIGEDVTSIGENAFTGYTGLNSVTLNSNAVVSKAYTESDNMRNIFGRVKEYIIGENVTSIGDYAFYDCGGLTSFTIPDNVTSIGDYAFYDCGGLTSFTIPDNVTSIGDYAFSGCSRFTSVTIPNSVTSIGESAFNTCSVVTLNSNAIASETYTSSSNLKNVFGEQVVEFIIGKDVTSIGKYAFSGYSSLTTITIPNSVMSIDDFAFYGCSGLTKVIVSDIAAWCGISFGNSSANPLYYAHHLYSDENTEITNLVMPDGVTSIGKYAFANCSSLTSVTIPNSVTSIGYDAFSDCSGLTSVTLHCKTVGSWFSGFKSIKEVILGNKVKSIGWDAFSDCSGLTSVTIPNSVTSIGERAFYECYGLTVTSIGERAFYECYGLTSVTIGNSVTSIGNYAFYFCYRLTSITIPNSVTSIGNYAFYDCGLTSIEIPNSVTSIGEGAFDWCTSLTSVTVLNPTPVVIAEDVFTNRTNAILYVPEGSKSAYQTADYWKEFKEIVEIDPSGIDQIMSNDKNNATIFTLDGKRIKKPQKGINIIDGKKVVVK